MSIGPPDLLGYVENFNSSVKTLAVLVLLYRACQFVVELFVEGRLKIPLSLCLQTDLPSYRCTIITTLP